MDSLAFSMFNLTVDSSKKECCLISHKNDKLKMMEPLNYEDKIFKTLFTKDALGLLKNLFQNKNIVHVQEYLNQDIYDLNPEFYNVWDIYIITQEGIDLYMATIYNWIEWKIENSVTNIQQYDFTRYSILEDDSPDYYDIRQKYMVDVVYNSENEHLIDFYERYMRNISQDGSEQSMNIENDNAVVI
jgi:hypothetical protein